MSSGNSSYVDARFQSWRARTPAGTPQTQPELAHNLSVFSYRHKRLMYTRLGHHEYTDADGQRLGDPFDPDLSSDVEQQSESEGYYQVKRFYPPSVTRAFMEMKGYVDQKNFRRPVATRVEHGGLRYSLRASPWLSPRLGKIIIFTANTTTHTTSWHHDFFRRWQRGEVTPPPERFRGDALWVMEVRHKTGDEVIEQHQRGADLFRGRACTELVRRVLTTDSLEAAEIRTGRTGLPYQMSVSAIDALDLIVIQRTHLSRITDPA